MLFKHSGRHFANVVGLEKDGGVPASGKGDGIATRMLIQKTGEVVDLAVQSDPKV